MISIPNIYKGNYILLSIPALILILLSAYFIFITPQIKMGVDFNGGMLISLSLDNQVDPVSLQDALKNEGYDASVKVFDTAVGLKAEIEIPQGENIIFADNLKNNFDELLEETASLEAISAMDESYVPEYKIKRAELDKTANELFAIAGISNDSAQIENLNVLRKTFLSAYSKVYKDYETTVSKTIQQYASYSSISIQSVSPRLSTHFIDSAVNVVIIAAILSTVLVFFFFRNIVPSFAVMLGAFCDIVLALGAMAFFQIPLTLPSFAALLLLIGYSLDTDILLTMRMLKRKGDPKEKAFDAMKTGITMTFTGIIAFLVLFILSIMTNIPTYYEISAVALAGLFGDLLATWGINAVILLKYLEKKEKDVKQNG
ncbi:MAG: hypothetical protein WC501_00630 [Candidatus Micrarchaeia archaeon]